MADDDNNLEVFWDDVRVAPFRRPPKQEDFGDQVGPGDMVIGTGPDRYLVIIKADGTLRFGPEYRPDEAAMVFWEAMGQRKLQMEDRLLVIGHMEAILTRLGEADLQAESARRIAANNSEDMELERRAIEAVNRFERVAGQAVELGRGLIRRPEVPMPAFPDEVPRSLREVEHSDYEGRDGVGESVGDSERPEPSR
jgi:hypothetical protein